MHLSCNCKQLWNKLTQNSVILKSKWINPLSIQKIYDHSQTESDIEELVEEKDATANLPDNSSEVNLDQSSTSKTKYVVPKPYFDKHILNEKSKAFARTKAYNALYMNPPNFEELNWPNKWPISKPFNPYLVPLPIRMGYAQNKCVTPDQYANLELMKVQNFLHLTPPAIEQHCEALRKFCTPFPAELKSDEMCEKLFPVESHSVDYIAAANTVRDDRARTVTKTVRLCNLVLNDHARRKFIKLLGKDRYNRKTDVATIKSERCPLKKQNSDFIDYVLTALYFESWVEEKWETRSQMNDYDGYYWWEESTSHKNIRNIFKNESDETLTKREEVENYRKAVTSIKLEPEPDQAGEMTESRAQLLESYKESVLKLLNLNRLT